MDLTVVGKTGRVTLVSDSIKAKNRSPAHLFTILRSVCLIFCMFVVKVSSHSYVTKGHRTTQWLTTQATNASSSIQRGAYTRLPSFQTKESVRVITTVVIVEFTTSFAHLTRSTIETRGGSQSSAFPLPILRSCFVSSRRTETSFITKHRRAIGFTFSFVPFFCFITLSPLTMCLIDCWSIRYATVQQAKNAQKKNGTMVGNLMIGVCECQDNVRFPQHTTSFIFPMVDRTKPSTDRFWALRSIRLDIRGEEEESNPLGIQRRTLGHHQEVTSTQEQPLVVVFRIRLWSVNKKRIMNIEWSNQDLQLYYATSLAA